MTLSIKELYDRCAESIYECAYRNGAIRHARHWPDLTKDERQIWGMMAAHAIGVCMGAAWDAVNECPADSTPLREIEKLNPPAMA